MNKHRRYSFFDLFVFSVLIISFLSFLVPVPCSAADTPDLETEQIVVTATRYREGVSSAAALVTVITREEIERSSARSIPEVLRLESSVHVNDIGGNQRHFTVDLRGFGESAALNTLVLVDGRKVNQADLSGTDWMLIPLERVERIEILHGGSGAVLYGDNASGGVIHIITKDGADPGVGASAAAGSYETYRGSAWADGTWKDLTYSLSARHLTSDGYRDNSATEGVDVGVNLSWYPLDYARIYLGGWYHHDDTGLPGAIRESDFAAGTQRQETLFLDDFSEIDEQVVKGGFEVSVGDDGLFTADLSRRRRDVSSFASFVGGNFTGDTRIDTVIVSPQFLTRRDIAGLPNVLTLGFDYHLDDEEITNESLFFGEETSGDFTLEKENYGVYLRDEIAIVEALALSAGYRYDRAEFSFGPESPESVDMDEHLYSAGINYTFREGSSAYVSYARSFRYPVLDELFNFFTNTINTDLVNQTTDGFEAGARYAFDGKTYVHLNLFHGSTDDEIFFNPLTFVNENLDGKAVRKGAELSFEARPAGWMALKGSYTYVRTKIDGGTFDGSRVPNVPESKAALMAVFFPAKGLALTLEGIYVGERPFISDFGNVLDNQDDYAVMNGKIEYRWKNVAASLAVNNLADREYAEYGALGGFPVERAWLPSPGRNFAVDLAVDF